MSELFLKIMNMSISASWLVLAVLLLRLVLKKAPKWVSVLLWGIVAVRLVLPFSFESVLSLIPSAETVSPSIMLDGTPEISTGIQSLDQAVNPIITQSFAPQMGASANPLQILIPVAAVIWMAGIAIMLLYTAISYFVLRHKVATAVRLQGNIFQSENVASPFVLGIVKPRIYLPFHMDGENFDYVIAHEQAHLRRKDHWWKPLGFVLLSLHWFNPLMWLGYILLCQDIELACDEKVIKEMDHVRRADYSQALVACSVSRRSIAACPLAFGEVGVKARVKSVLNYKKPAFWLLLAAIILCTAVAVCFLTDPLPHTLQNIEFYNLGTNTLDRTTVLVSDGTTHQYAGAVERSLLQELYDLKISRNEVSLDRGEDRSKQNTLIFGIPSQEESELLKSFVGSIQIHFNADFTEVWADDAVKPTLSYRVLEPQKAQLIYLRIYNTLDSGIIAKSGNNQVNLIAVPATTVIPALVDAVEWLTIAPGEEEFVPFRVLKNNQERNGRYGIYDAQTFQPLDYFLPSGLSPQTYLFQNADPDREYLVTVSLSDESGASDYAFGVRFDKTVAPFLEIRNPWVQEYVPGSDGIQGEEDTDKYLSVSTDFAIGADGYGYAVFKDPNRAFRTFTTLYADGIEAIRSQYDLDPISWSDFDLYKTYGWQTTEGTSKALEQARFVTGFLDIFENSFTDDHDPSLVCVVDSITTDRITYYELSDGTWRADGRNYRYRLTVTGHVREITEDSTFVFLSNLETITFDQAWMASGLASSFLDYFKPHEAILVEADIRLENDASIVDTITTDLMTYYELSDGTWRADGRNYRYRLEIRGRMHSAATESTFVYLSNIENISFEQAWRAAGLSSNSEDYFRPEEAVLVDWRNGDGDSVFADVDKIILVDPDTFEVVQIIDPRQPELLEAIGATKPNTEGYGLIFHGEECVLRVTTSNAPLIGGSIICYTYTDGLPYPTRWTT